MNVTKVRPLPDGLEEALTKMYYQRKGNSKDFYMIGNGYFSSVYAWNKNYNYIVKWYNDNVKADTAVGHLPDHAVLKALNYVAHTPDLIAYNDKFCVMTRAKGYTLDSVHPSLLMKHRQSILDAVGWVANNAYKAGFLVNDLNLGNVTLNAETGEVYVIDFNSYIELEYRVEAFRGLNQFNRIFDQYSMDVLSDSAIETYLIHTINNFVDLMDYKIQGAS